VLNLGNENANVGHIKVSRGPQVPHPWCSAMNNIIDNRRNLTTTFDATNPLFISIVGPPSLAWDPDPYVKTLLGKGNRTVHSTSSMAHQKRKEDSNCELLW